MVIFTRTFTIRHLPWEPLGWISEPRDVHNLIERGHFRGSTVKFEDAGGEASSADPFPAAGPTPAAGRPVQRPRPPAAASVLPSALSATTPIRSGSGPPLPIAMGDRAKPGIFLHCSRDSLPFQHARQPAAAAGGSRAAARSTPR